MIFDKWIWSTSWRHPDIPVGVVKVNCTLGNILVNKVILTLRETQAIKGQIRRNKSFNLSYYLYNPYRFKVKGDLSLNFNQ